MDPITQSLIMAAAQAFIGAGVNAAMPKYGMTQPGGTPDAAGGMDLNALVAQSQGDQSLLPSPGKLQFHDPFNPYHVNA